MKDRDRYGLRWLACAAALSACDGGDMSQGPTTVDMRFRPRVDVAVGASPKALAVGDVNENYARAAAPRGVLALKVRPKPPLHGLDYGPEGEKGANP